MRSAGPRRTTAGYIVVLLAAFAVALIAGWSDLATRMDGEAYDWMYAMQGAGSEPPATSVVLAFDERSLSQGGLAGLRPALIRTLRHVAAAGPAVVAIDVILADATDPGTDAELARVLRRLPKLVLASEVLPETEQWERPREQFLRPGVAVGHAHARPDPVSRVIPLEVTAGKERHWALALEAMRLRYGAESILESPHDLQVGSTVIPASRRDGRTVYIRYRNGIPVVPVLALTDAAVAERLRGKTVFVGVTAQSAARDRLMTPLGRMMSGVEIHAQAYETLVNREFMVPAPHSVLVALCLIFTVAAGIIFAALSGWRAYVAGAGVLAVAHATPHLAFARGYVLPFLAPIWCAWLPVVTAAAWQYFAVRRQLQKTQSDKDRYRQYIHMVTHEMRSPLTAIQGQSEMMGRYTLPEEKRKQMAQMINAESKRMARMIQTFLDLERLTDGQIEVAAEPFLMTELVDACVDRSRPLAERKEIEFIRGEVQPLQICGDRELMEYALYNLLTNAVKYSPAGSRVRVSATADKGQVRLAVQDEGMGMDEKELRSIFKKFYRTKRAEASGEVGTGIGLSLVQEIVHLHDGRMEVVSQPNAGSCFTMVLPAYTRMPTATQGIQA
jgi:signal transduction histidine kinase